MAGRYAGWKRVRGDSGNPELVSIGQKLLGQLQERRRLSGIKTVELSHRLPNGASVRARFVGDVPLVEIIDVGGRVQAIPTRLLQGFVVRPEASLPTDLDEALLIPGAPIDPDNRPWACLYYDPTHTPTPGPAIGGSYRATARGDALFNDGLRAGGNLDWRNTDESVVVTFFGPEDRYALNGNIWGNNDPARWTGSTFLCPFSTLIMINGDVVMDFADHPDYNEFDVVTGACVRGSTLIWCLVGRDAPAQYMRFYTAPLARRPGYEWAVPPPSTGPRFARIDHANTTLLHEELLDLFDYFFLFASQPFCFNQSATEGRMFTEGPGGAAPSNNDGTHELVFNFADLENPIFTDTWIGEDVTVTGNVGGDDQASMTAVLNGWETTTNDGYKATLPIRYKSNYYKRTQAHDPVLNKIAVDYKNDVPVYLQVRQPLETFREATVLTNPVCVPGVDSFTTSNSTSSSQTQLHEAALVFPWGLEVELDRSFERTHSGSASSAYTDTTWTDFTGTFITASSETHSAYHVEIAHILFCDLRNDTAVYGLLTTDATEDITHSASLVPTSTTVLGPWERTTTTDRHLTRTWQSIVHSLGVDVVVSAPQLVQDLTTNTPEFTSTPTNSSSMDDFVSRAHDTGPGLGGVGGPAAADSGEQAFRAQSTAINNSVIAAGVGVEVAITVANPPLPFPATIDYADTRGIAALADVPFPSLHPPTLGWLYSGGGESTSIMPWAKQDISFSIPLADPEAAPYEFVRESAGAWQTLVDATVFTMPWPTGTAEGYLSGASDADFQTVTGLAGDGIHLPIWLMSRFQTR